jgi:heat shock protein HtpX
MKSSLSIRTRAVLAVALLVGFYTLALAIAAALVYVPYAEWTYADRIHLKILLFCGVGAFLILKAIVPRPDRFDPPGPRLTADAHPRLLALVDEVARATDQAPPAEVYLVPEVNAFVAERGGTMGLGARRVMGIGLPLLEVLTVEELRAVIAHEFGHYVSGDTRLGPWIYKTRVALGRTLESVAGHSAVLAKPFEWYGKAFLRVTHAVSRAQEFVADATAARVAGREAMKRALVRIAGGAGAFDVYWNSEVAPTLDHGFRPPLAAGFRQFLVAPSVAPEVSALVDRRLEDTTTDPYDTHPNLRDRLAALERLPDATRAITWRDGDDAPATALLSDVDGAEAALLATLTRRGTFAPIAWDAVPTTVLPIGWEEAVREAAPGFAGLTPERLPEIARDLNALALRLRLVPMAGAVRDEHRHRAAWLVGAAMSLALLGRVSAGDPPGLRIEAPPGEPVRFVIGATELRPFAVCEQLGDGSLDAEAWAALCAATGISGADFGASTGGRASAVAPNASAAHA